MEGKDRPRARIPAEIDEVELVVEKLVQGGEGLGRYGGVPVFVRLAAPGDRLRVRLTERRADYCRGEIEEVLEPGPHRREPPCRHFEQCGGCDLQFLDDSAQVEIKVQAALETLRRIGHLEIEEAETVVGSPWHYRCRTQVHLETADAGALVGYRKRGSRQLVAVEECPILTRPLEQVVVSLAKDLGSQESVPPRVDLAASGGSISSAPPISRHRAQALTLEVGKYRYRFDARCFFQGHEGLTERLVEVALGTGSGAEAWDLYSGVGLFSLPLSAAYERVVAVDSDRVAVRYARKNARTNRRDNIEVVRAALERHIDRLPFRIDRVVVDPPRAGLHRKVRETLLDKKPGQITYVSCQPATLARDLKSLLTGYSLESVTFLDLFPQTSHIEVVVQLKLMAEEEDASD